MKATLVFLFAFAAVALGQKYTDRYDNTNVEEILGNDRLYKGFLNCILDIGPCTADGKELKSHIIDALENGCAKCTEAQQKGVKVVIKDLIRNKPADWERLKQKYDPTGKFTKKYENEYKKL